MAVNNPFTDPETAASYEIWYQTVGRWADQQEKALLKWLLSKFKAARSILEVGSGTGHFTRWLSEQGLLALGLDSSRPMLEEAMRLKSPACLQADATALPFRSASVDLVAFITTFEFLPDPIQALAEAIRVAREGLVLGVLNAQSRLGRQYKHAAGPIWEAARFYTPNELKRVVHEVAGDKPKVVWRTTLWSCWTNALPLPWGGFIGMTVKLH